MAAFIWKLDSTKHYFNYGTIISVLIYYRINIFWFAKMRRLFEERRYLNSIDLIACTSTIVSIYLQQQLFSERVEKKITRG